jgi:chromosome segregation ATPase
MPAEPTYTITETELNELQNNLTELKTINEALRTACSGQQIKAAELQVKLTKAEELSRTLQSQLTELQAKSTRQEALLTQANESLKEYAREEKRTRLRIKAQRNVWETAAGLLLVGLAMK